MNKKLAVIVLTWNDWKNTIECLESIFNNSFENFDIILVDNNSDLIHIEKINQWSKNFIKVEDNEFKFNSNKKIDLIKINKNFKISNNICEKKIYLIQNNKNLGLTAGLNVGYEFILNQKYDYVARIDCDFIIPKNYLKDMVNLFEKDDLIVAASPKIKHAYMRDTVWWYKFRMNWFYLKFHQTVNLQKKRILDNSNISGIISTDSICGCCSFYRIEKLKLCGLGDEEFFLGPEDIELSYRLKNFGNLVSNLDCYTFHKVARSGAVSGKFRRSYTDAMGFLLLIKKIGTFSDKLFGYFYFILRIPFFFILLIFKKREKERVLGYFFGCKDFFLKKK
tara:strand:- start:48 stop:1055 length:1008 start_codon:yes stop_codon:yes gene_type:complete